MELCFREQVRKPVTRPLVPFVKAMTRLPVPNFDPVWIPPGALEKLRREQQKKPKDERQQPQLPLYDDLPNWQPQPRESPTEERGVVIIEF